MMFQAVLIDFLYKKQHELLIVIDSALLFAHKKRQVIHWCTF